MTELITALDYPDAQSALKTVDLIGPSCQWYKVGKELFTAVGPAIVQELKARGKKVFLDMKFHDIPNTVSKAVHSAAAIGADLCNVHASGGTAMLTAAGQAAKDAGILLVAVTVLTSMDAAELASIGLSVTPQEQVKRLALLTQTCGVPGIVCSALELPVIRETCGADFITVVPGIRPAGSSADDQKRIMTPAQAAQADATYIVVGRPITKAENPAEAAAAIAATLASQR